LGEFGERNTSGGHTGEVEAVRSASTSPKKGTARQIGRARPFATRSMSRPPKKQAPEPAPPSKQYRWAIYRLKGTPAALLGQVEVPDAETAIKKAIDEFAAEPALHKRLLAQRRT
jgi:hypothetical protein